MNKKILSVILAVTLATSVGMASTSIAAKKVSISEKKVILSTGATKKLRLINAKGKISWTSTKKNVASVSKKGVVKAKKAGTTNIVAKYNKKSYKCVVTVYSYKKELEATKAIVEEYNKEVDSYAEKITPYNDAVKQINDQIDKLSAAISSASAEIEKNETPFDENTRTELKNAITESSSISLVKATELEPFFKTSVDEGLKLTDLLIVKETAQKNLDKVKNTTIPEIPVVPDYSSNITSLQTKTKAYSDSVTGLKQITAPPDAFCMSRLKRISTITDMAPCTEDHDPNGHLGKQGGYIGCIYFADSRVDRSKVYIEDGKDNVIDIGTEGGGALEIYPDVAGAEKRNTYLGALDGGILDSGSHYVYGTIVVRTSTHLKASDQIDLTNSIVKALIAVD